MSKKNGKRWWELTSAADDGDVDLDDDGDQSDSDWVDRFNFNDYRPDKGLSSTDAIWNRYGYTGSSLPTTGSWRNSGFAKSFGKDVDFATAKKVEAAQKLVQGFVDTFALDNPLSARFSDRSAQVGGEEGATSVVVSHRPLLDPTINEQQAHRIMTAQAANAAAIARFGGEESHDRQYAVALEAMNLPEIGPVLRDLGKILDGYRIDSAFRRDYPGYADVYAPAQEYIARGLLKGREAFDLEDFAGASIANAALNFGDFTNWSGREQERVYWSHWANQYASGSIEDFVKGVLEGAQHINVALPPKPEPPKGQPKGKGDEGGQPGGDPGPGSGDSGDDEGKGQGRAKGKPEDSEQDDDSDEQASDDSQDDTDSPTGEGDDSQDDPNDSKPEQGEGGEKDPDQPSDDWDDEDESGKDGGGGATNGSVDLPTGLGNGVSLTGLANGQSKELDEDDAERLAQTAGALAVGLDEKEVGEVYWNANGFRGDYRQSRLTVKPEAAANGFIRRAFTRSKTAHYAIERGHRNGRIDNRSLPRIASDDFRLFSKRRAPSDTKYRVWLLIDNSGSMGGEPVIDAANLAASVALAVRHIPNVVLDVWAWTSGIKVPDVSFSAVRIYADGDPIAKIGDVGILPQGGTPDAALLSWAAREIRKQCRPDETPVILMASDGTGSLNGETMYADPALHAKWRQIGVSEDTIREYADKDKHRVADARKAGVKVLSVAIGNLDQESQDRTYGKGNHLLWNGSIKTMAKPLGDLIARVASNRIK